MDQVVAQQPAEIPLQQKESGYNMLEYISKRVLDLSMVLPLSIITLPIFLYSAYKIKKESPEGSIIFKQQRIGLNGQEFTCYKFRSMHSNSHFDPYTQENDIRIFPYGNLMRKMRIDELPQLWNILKGDMHLVGPRAEWNILVKEYEKKIPHYHQRHCVRPGITGLAQVSYPYGRDLQDTKNKLKYDLLYIQKWSILLELNIILKTIKIVLGKQGV